MQCQLNSSCPSLGLQVVGASALADYRLPCQATALFSSTASVWSQAGAGHYSASNCFLDGLAHSWQAAGCPATAVNFGPFGDTGMAAALRCVWGCVGQAADGQAPQMFPC